MSLVGLHETFFVPLPHHAAVPMATDSYRGFTFERYRVEAAPRRQALRATRGRITLFVEVSEGVLPSGWGLRDILEYEINRLLEPTTLRHVDHLN